LSPDPDPDSRSEARSRLPDGPASHRHRGPETSAAEATHFSEDEALAILKRSDVSAERLAELARNTAALKSRKVLFGLTTHLRTPRHVSIPLLRRLFTFDLMQVALTSVVPADIKRLAEEQLMVRLASLPAGEKISLARRGPGRIVAELLRDPDRRVVLAALENSRLLEAEIVTALLRPDALVFLFALVSEDRKWSQRREVQIALLRSQKTPLEFTKRFAKGFPPEFLRSIVPSSRMAALMDAASEGT
jgi:hypothetical protein